jgi:hypothetical protein
MEEGIAGSVGKRNKAEALVRVVPFDDGLDRGPGRRVKPLGAEFRRRWEIAPGHFVVVVGEGAAPRRDENLYFCCSRECLGPSGTLSL